jgi:hypothetical protein
MIVLPFFPLYFICFVLSSWPFFLVRLSRWTRSHLHLSSCFVSVCCISEVGISHVYDFTQAL